MSEQGTPSQDPSLRAGNRVADGSQIDIAKYTELLINDPEIAKLDEFNRRVAISDRVVGAIVANGTVQSSIGEHTPADILRLFDRISNVMSKGAGPQAMREITRATGLRETFDLLAKNGVGSFGSMQERAGLAGYGSGMSSTDMLEGYLGTIQEKYHRTHPHEVMRGGVIEGIQENIKAYIELVGVGSNFTTAMSGRAESDNTYLRQEGNKFKSAIQEATNWGVDSQILNHTADRLRTARRMEVHIGTHAVVGAGVSNEWVKDLWS